MTFVAIVFAMVFMFLGFIWAFMIEDWRDAVGSLLVFGAGAALAAWVLLS